MARTKPEAVAIRVAVSKERSATIIAGEEGVTPQAVAQSLRRQGIHLKPRHEDTPKRCPVCQSPRCWKTYATRSAYCRTCGKTRREDWMPGEERRLKALGDGGQKRGCAVDPAHTVWLTEGELKNGPI